MSNMQGNYKDCKFTRIGISGICSSGKDTFYSLLSQRINCKRVALADQLRREINPFIIDKFNIDLFNCSRPDKDLVRPLLVEYARIKRSINDRYFIDKVDSYIKSLYSVAVISDIRYINEVDWLKNDLNGVLVHVSKFYEYNKARVFPQSPIKDEQENDPKLRELADYKIEWPEVNDKNLDLLASYADNFLAWLNQKQNNL